MRGLRSSEATRARRGWRGDGGAGRDLRSLGEFRITVRPLIWLRNAALGAASFAFLINPTFISQASDRVPPPPPTAEQLWRSEKTQIVLNELGPKLTKATPREIQQVSAAIVDECWKTGVDPLFVLAIIESESNFDLEAVSPTGARGLMQIIPSTFKQMSTSKRMFDPVENVRAGIRYVKHLWDAGFGRKGGPESVLLAYNQGPKKAVEVYKNGEPVPDEAQVYVPRVMSKYRALLLKHGHKPKEARKLFIAMR